MSILGLLRTAPVVLRLDPSQLGCVFCQGFFSVYESLAGFRVEGLGLRV